MRAIKILNGIVILLFLIPFSLQATQVFNYKKEGFSIAVPTGWIAIPTYMVESSVRAASQFAPTVPTQHYQYGFQLNTAGGWFLYPYILIGIKSIKKVSPSDLEHIINLQHTKKIDKVKDILKPLVGDVKVSGVNYEPSSQIVWLRINTDNIESGAISSICGIILTEQGAVQVTGFTKRSEFEKYFSIFEKVIRSVEVTQPIAYPSSETENVSTYSYWHFIGAGLLISLIFVLLFFIVNKLNKKTPIVDEDQPSPSSTLKQNLPVQESPKEIEPVVEIVEQETTYSLILPKSQNYYDILGVDRQAEEIEIKRAAQAKLKEVRAELETLGAHERSVYGKIAKSKGEKIKKAFHTLADAERREKYDAKLLTNSAPETDS